MLIFIGVLFTCVIPLFLYVNNVNSFYDQAVVDMRREDQEREMERLEVYAYPTDNNTKLNVFVKSMCALEVRLVRVWVNDTFYDEIDFPSCLPVVLSGVSDGDISNITISSPGYFDVWVMTDRGNVFASLTNTIHVTNETDWEPGAYNFGIHIFITEAGKYNVTVSNDSGFSEELESIKSAPTAYRMIPVPKPATYNVTVTKQGSSELWHYDCYVSWTYPHAQIEVPP